MDQPSYSCQRHRLLVAVALAWAVALLLGSCTSTAAAASSSKAADENRLLYSSKSPVRVLSASEFKNVKNGNQASLVEFFAPWCGHCKQFAPTFEKVAEALVGIVNVVAVEDSEVMQGEAVKSFPTIKLYFGKGSMERPVTFSGQRTAEALLSFVIDQLSATAHRRAGLEKPQPQSSTEFGSDEVVELHDGNFEKMVLADEDNVWFVEFYAPWCGHCQSLAPTWTRLAGVLGGKVKVAKIDATTNPIRANEYQIKGFPTLKLFPAGKKSKQSVVAYDEARDLQSLTKFALGFASKSIKAEQLRSDEMFRNTCTSQLCILTFLPDILDSRAAGRDKLLVQLNDAVMASSMMPVRFLWAQGGDNIKFEEQLHLQFGYPAVVAVHLGKQKFAVSRGSFSTPVLRSFLTALMAGKEPLMDIPENLERIKSVEPWDGKDGAPPVQEEVSLDDEL